MSPKEKAIALLAKFEDAIWPSVAGLQDTEECLELCKQCALIAVEAEYAARIKAYGELEEFCPDVVSQAIIYAEKEYEQVKTEIENL